MRDDPTHLDFSVFAEKPGERKTEAPRHPESGGQRDRNEVEDHARGCSKAADSGVPWKLSSASPLWAGAALLTQDGVALSFLTFCARPSGSLAHVSVLHSTQVARRD